MPWLSSPSTWKNWEGLLGLCPATSHRFQHFASCKQDTIKNTGLNLYKKEQKFKKSEQKKRMVKILAQFLEDQIYNVGLSGALRV